MSNFFKPKVEKPTGPTKEDRAKRTDTGRISRTVIGGLAAKKNSEVKTQKKQILGG